MKESASLDSANTAGCPQKATLPKASSGLEAQLLRAVGHAIIAADCRGNIIFWNKAAEALYGWSAEEVLGHNGWQFVAPHFSEQQMQELSDRLHAGETWEVQVSLRRRDGSQFEAAVVNAPLRDAKHQLTGIVSSITDVTSRADAEAAVLQTSTSLAEAQRIAKIGSWEWDVQTGEVSWSDQLFEILGLPKETPPRHDTYTELLHPGDRARAQEELRLSLIDKPEIENDYRLLLPDGTVKMVHARGVITRDQNGRPLRLGGTVQDITERWHAQEALQESERKYRELVELSHDLVWAVDVEGRITYMSRASRHIYGREPEEMLGHLFTDFMTPDEARRSMANLSKMIATGDYVTDFEAHLLHRDGHEIVLSANAMVLRDAAGNIVGTTGTSRDITERKHAEVALRESEQRFRELAENIHEVFWMSDPENTQMFYVSPAYATIWGRSRETLYSSPDSWMDAIHPDDKERMVRTRATRASAFPHDNTYRIVRPDGSVRWIRDRGFPVRDERGAVVRFAGIAEDVTVRKETEEAQERGLSLMLATLESTADGILVVNADGKIETFNRLFARMWRLPDDVLASKEDARALDFVLDQLIEPKKFVEKVRYLYRHPEEESSDRLSFKDGRVFERYSRPQLIGGKVVGRVWSFRDATERRQAAKALEGANERLRLLSRRLFQVQEDERRHLARELHDEIGQTLTAAKINLQIIAQEVPAKMAGRLDDSIQLLDRLLGQVRQLSLDLRPPLLDELGLVPTLRWLVDQQAQRAGLRVTFRTDVDGLEIDSTVQTTCFRVAQEAITNIIRHAGAQKIAIVLWRRGARLWLSVNDDGAGFDPAPVPRLAAHHSSLGLVSMKERISLVGGGLDVRSSPGKGTEIRAWFPVAIGEQSIRTETS